MSDAVPAGWAPVRVSLAGGRLLADCRAVDMGRLASAFFDEDVNAAMAGPFAAAFGAEADLGALAEGAAEAPAPDGLILHSSRCGSSLLVRVLQRPPDRVVSEPSAVGLLLRHSAGRPEAERAAMLRALVGLFCRRAPGEAPGRTFLKLDSWSAIDLPVIRRAFPETPWAFAYRDPVEVIVSHALRPSGALESRADVAWLLGISQAEALGATVEELCARLLGRTFESALAHLGAGPLLLPYPAIVAGALELLPQHFGVAWGPAAAAHARRAAQFHAKHPGEYFMDDTAAKRRAASSDTLAAAERWARAPFDALEAARLAAARETASA